MDEHITKIIKTLKMCGYINWTVNKAYPFLSSCTCTLLLKGLSIVITMKVTL